MSGLLDSASSAIGRTFFVIAAIGAIVWVAGRLFGGPRG